MRTSSKSTTSTDQDVRGVVMRALDKVAEMNRSTVQRHVQQTRNAHPQETPEQILKRLERRYLASVSSSGAACGAAAAVPGVGTAAGLALAAGDTVNFIAISGLYALAVAEVYGVELDDIERRRTLIMAVMLGDTGTATVTRIAERSGQHWGRQIVAKVPVTTLRQVNRVLGRNFVTKYGTKQGILVLGKQVPFGIGAAIGGGGNYAFGRITIGAAHRAFGEPPTGWSTVDARTSQAQAA